MPLPQHERDRRRISPALKLELELAALKRKGFGLPGSFPIRRSVKQRSRFWRKDKHRQLPSVDYPYPLGTRTAYPWNIPRPD